MAKDWFPLLLNAFLASPTNQQRSHIEAAISAYACICGDSTLVIFFRAAVTKLIKVRFDFWKE